MGRIALYQSGIIRRLPDLPLPLMDADKIDASEEAYAHCEIGDAFIGLGSYAATMGLAATFATVPLVMGEAPAAARQLGKKL